MRLFDTCEKRTVVLCTATFIMVPLVLSGLAFSRGRTDLGAAHMEWFVGSLISTMLGVLINRVMQEPLIEASDLKDYSP